MPRLFNVRANAWENLPDNWYQEHDARRARMAADAARSNRNHKRLVSLGKIATMAGAGAGGIAALGGGGAAAANVPTVISAAKSGVPWWRLGEVGVNLFGNLMGQRSSSRGNDRALRAEIAAGEEQQTRLRELETRRQYEWDAQQKQLGISFEADQEQRRLDRAASDEERAFDRSTFEARESRRAPYRQAGQQALMSLSQLARLSGG